MKTLAMVALVALLVVPAMGMVRIPIRKHKSALERLYAAGLQDVPGLTFDKPAIAPRTYLGGGVSSVTINNFENAQCTLRRCAALVLWNTRLWIVSNAAARFL